MHLGILSLSYIYYDGLSFLFMVIIYYLYSLFFSIKLVQMLVHSRMLLYFSKLKVVYLSKQKPKQSTKVEGRLFI